MISARRSFGAVNVRAGAAELRPAPVAEPCSVSSKLLGPPRNWVNTSAIADVNEPWAAGYSGWFGVVRRGRQPASSTVAGLPSSTPGADPNRSPPGLTDVGSIAVTGRQKR